MRHIIQTVVLLGLGVFVLVMGYSRTEAVRPEDKVEEITAVLEETGATVQGWSMLAKEETDAVHDIHTFHQLLEQLKAKTNGADWVIEKSSEGYKASAVKKFPDYEERLVVTWSPVHTIDKTFIIYEVSGTKWDEAIFEKREKIFSQKSTNYACVRAVLNDKIEGVLLTSKATEILNKFQAKPVEASQERAFVTVSAYTGKWNDALSVDKEKMNMQVALRNAKDMTTIVIGTPIITSEY